MSGSGPVVRRSLGRTWSCTGRTRVYVASRGQAQKASQSINPDQTAAPDARQRSRPPHRRIGRWYRGSSGGNNGFHDRRLGQPQPDRYRSSRCAMVDPDHPVATRLERFSPGCFRTDRPSPASRSVRSSRRPTTATTPYGAIDPKPTTTSSPVPIVRVRSRRVRTPLAGQARSADRSER
jgi:hypothetical protein